MIACLLSASFSILLFCVWWGADPCTLVPTLPRQLARLSHWNSLGGAECEEGREKFPFLLGGPLWQQLHHLYDSCPQQSLLPWYQLWPDSPHCLPLPRAARSLALANQFLPLSLQSLGWGPLPALANLQKLQHSLLGFSAIPLVTSSPYKILSSERSGVILVPIFF